MYRIDDDGDGDAAAVAAVVAVAVVVVGDDDEKDDASIVECADDEGDGMTNDAAVASRRCSYCSCV